ncbi:MAG TPA: hypothetical protein VL053_18665 [Arachidicoccus sp.]|nr:hypothetical protein [Arachidicoccus sp.]
MHTIEPFFNWRHLYTSEEDERSPFYGREYSEFEFTNAVYNYYIHPQWDEFGSSTLFCKIIYADYEMRFCVIELIGEWNDTIENDIMTLRYNLADDIFDQGITHFIFIGENVLNFHGGERDYYEEWYEEVSDADGWIVLLNLSEPARDEFKKYKLQYYIELMQLEDWRVYKPHHLFQKIDQTIMGRLDDRS